MSITATIGKPRKGTAQEVAAQAMREHVAGLVADFDAFHRDGLAIPPKAAEAVQTLAALSVAWSANAKGQPAPFDAKRQLGLLPRAADGSDPERG